MEPASIVVDTEQTQFSLQTNGRTEDRWTDNMKWLYPLNLVYREQGVCVCVWVGVGGLWGGIHNQPENWATNGYVALRLTMTKLTMIYTYQNVNAKSHISTTDYTCPMVCIKLAILTNIRIFLQFLSSLSIKMPHTLEILPQGFIYPTQPIS